MCDREGINPLKTWAFILCHKLCLILSLICTFTFFSIIMPELWVGIIFEERVMGSAAAAFLPGLAPGVSGEGHRSETGKKEVSCALLEAAQFIIDPGPFRSPLVVRINHLSMKRAGLNLAFF
jgi:hypothetical protein